MHLEYHTIKDIIDDKYTLADLKEMRTSLIGAARSYANKMSELMPGIPLNIVASESHIDQVLIDAVEDLKRLVDFQPTNNPNVIKEAAYICYWWLKHKPIVVLNNIAELKINDENKLNLLFANEVMMRAYIESRIFDFTELSCKVHTEEFKANWKAAQGYILYVLAYRATSPKLIESFLITSTLHPIWKANTDFWKRMV